MSGKFGTVYCGAHDCAPKQCHCGARLSRPVHGYVEHGSTEIAQRYKFPTREARQLREVWHIVCSCNARYVWSGGHPKRNGAWYVYPVWPMQIRKLLPDNGKRYTRLAS